MGWNFSATETAIAGNKYEVFAIDKLTDAMGWNIHLYTTKDEQLNIGESVFVGFDFGVEIKHDRNMARTGNLYIEYEEKGKGLYSQWRRSGIHRYDNSALFAIGDYNELFVFDIEVLRALFQDNTLRHVQTQTSKGFLIPKHVASRYCFRYFSFKGRRTDGYEGEFYKGAEYSHQIKQLLSTSYGYN